MREVVMEVAKQTRHDASEIVKRGIANIDRTRWW
jgi:hypothetical protein